MFCIGLFKTDIARPPIAVMVETYTDIIDATEACSIANREQSVSGYQWAWFIIPK